MRSIPFEFVAGIAAEFGAVECLWRESDSSFIGYVAKAWFHSMPKVFAVKWGAVVGYCIKVTGVSFGPGRFVARVPVVPVHGEVKLGWLSRGSRVWLRR